ncbi:DUF4433 domain-containing protein [Actinomadura sp. LD22]|uniref:DUF4433 domain-containing protein n=1 Tax=Actinomadura physcomitrii TaxID=2650748 RepID=A0A6I4MK14_9ACTN|nr:DUF4433 domain-containing protein [Actinomadura physcomitrii]MWA05280.1 DUF4433 domain-containing protein [Actinomadura physcomitrii]
MIDAADPWLLHFTHLDNLAEIARTGLLADNLRRADVHECGQPSIKERRRSRVVPVPPGGVVADYAPFYFAPRSPMLRSILGGKVRQYDSDQTHLVYLVTRLSRVAGAGLPWVATDRNAVLRPTRFTTDAAALAEHIDWEIMNARYWGNTPEDGSRRERRMAELLVHGNVPWRTFSHLAVCCNERAGEAAERLEAAPTTPRVLVRPDWYFDVPSGCPCQGVWSWGGGESDDR